MITKCRRSAWPVRSTLETSFPTEGGTSGGMEAGEWEEPLRGQWNDDGEGVEEGCSLSGKE